MSIRIFLLATGLCLAGSSYSQRPTELMPLSTVHQAVENFTPNSLYNILVSIDPDLILSEVDSSFFTKEFRFNRTWDGNERIATARYMDAYEVDVRSYDFTGRNGYRVKIGSRPTDAKAPTLLDSLYKSGALTAQEQKTFQEFLEVSTLLNSFAYSGAKSFNNTTADSIAEVRQRYQYQKLLKIIDNNSIFHSTFLTKADGDSISYALGYKRAGEFWNLRNQTMARHILHFVNEYQGKRIVVLNGYYHRYYLKSLLAPKQGEDDFVLKEFDEY